MSVSLPVGMALLLVVCAGEGRAEEVRVFRGSVQETVVTFGVLKPHGFWKLSSPFSGRVEEVRAVPWQRVVPEEPLGFLVSTELARILDAAQTTDYRELQKRWEEIYRPYPLLAPFPGILVSAEASQGEEIQRGRTLMVLARNMVLEATAIAQEGARVRVGQRALVQVRRGDESERFPAAVTKVTAPHRRQKRYQVEVQPDQILYGFPDGTEASAKIVVAHAENVLLVPLEAVKRFGGSPYVCTAVETGLSDGKFIEVRGLGEGVRIYVSERAGLSAVEPVELVPLRIQTQ